MRICVRQALLGLFLLGSSMLGQVQAGEPIRVLFVGNSYTFVNDLPAMVRQMSVDAGQPRPLDVKHVTFSGASLEEHWKPCSSFAPGYPCLPRYGSHCWSPFHQHRRKEPL